ncbi:MAG: hypothetical protein FJ405_02145 [Verrucomicrobia bacterium]|nr:hypothetical protein [Verrucomicrobiota bacterium]
MNRLNVIFTLCAAYGIVFLQTSVNWPRALLGAQPDLLPSLVVYAALTSGLGLSTTISICGGLWMDSLSRNPLGISILPLFLAGVIIERYRGLILRDQTYAQFVIGACASAAAPVITLILILNTSLEPMVGWTSLWQWGVMALAGGFMTPAWFWLFAWLLRGFSYETIQDPTGHSNRQIKRGRS